VGGGSVPLITIYLLKQQNKTKTAKKQTKHTKKTTTPKKHKIRKTNKFISFYKKKQHFYDFY
jgi:hypothetical protein